MRYPVMFFLLAVVFTAHAQDTLTLHRALDMALSQNPSLRASELGRTSAEWGKRNAVARFLPQVTLSGSVVRIDPQSEIRANAAVDFIKGAAGALGIPASMLSEIRPFAYRDTYSTDITVIQPVYNGGAEILGVRAAAAQEFRAESEYRDTEQDVLAKVTTAYLTVLKAEELVGLARESLDRAQRSLAMTRRRAEIGQRTRTDVLRWEVEQGSSEGNLIAAENGLALARLQLNDLLGVELDRRFELERLPVGDGIRVSAPTASRASLDLFRPATPELLEHHPSLEVMQAHLRLADLGVSKAWVNFQPRVNLAFQYGWEKNNTLKLDGIRPWALSLSVSYPIFNGFGDYSALQQAQAEYERAETQMQMFRRGLQMQATNAELSLRSARQRLEVARTARDQAQDVLQAVTHKYENGGAANVDLLDVHTAYAAAQTTFITSAYDVAIAAVQLARAVGTITRSTAISDITGLNPS